MTSAVAKKDFIDISIEYVNKNPNEFFKSIYQMVFWNKYISGTEHSGIKKTLSSCISVINSFSLIFFMDNLNNLRNHFLGKKTPNLSILIPDIIGNCADSVLLVSATAGIISVSSTILDSFFAISEVALIASSVQNAAKDIIELKKAIGNKRDVWMKVFNLVKNLGLFGIGFWLFYAGFFALPLMTTTITTCSLSIVISNFLQFLIENNYILPKTA